MITILKKAKCHDKGFKTAFVLAEAFVSLGLVSSVLLIEMETVQKQLRLEREEQQKGEELRHKKEKYLQELESTLNEQKSPNQNKK